MHGKCHISLVIFVPTDENISITSIKYPSPSGNMLCLGDSISYSCELTDSASTSLTWRVTYLDDTVLLARRYDINSDLNTVSQLGNSIKVVLRSFDTTKMYMEANLLLIIRADNVAILNGAILECSGDFRSTYVAITDVVGKFTGRYI